MTTRNFPPPHPSLSGLPFWVMDGLGNDFVILDRRDQNAGPLPADAARLLGDRSGTFGCDQIITLDTGPDGTEMGITNADGSPAEACGNAARCVAWLLMQESGTDAVRFGSPAGALAAAAAGDTMVSVDMGPPKFAWEEIPLAEAAEDTRYVDVKLGPIDNPVLWGPSAVNVGNPHCVFFVDDVDAHALDRFGPLVENHPLFPEGVNVSLAAVEDEKTIRLRTWERGVGLTEACGTAACAATVAAHRRRKIGRQATVHLPGGQLTISWREEDNHILMTGPIRKRAEGRFS